MTVRLVALGAALAIAAILFAAAFYGVQWLMVNAIHIVTPSHLPRRSNAFFPILTSMMISVYSMIFVMFFAMRESRTKRAKKDRPLMLTPRIRRSPVTGQREL